MPDLFAACTPNSLPGEDGRTEHGYQLNILDGTMTILETVNLPDWDTFHPEEATGHLARAGYALHPSSPEWTPAGLGFMASLVRTAREAAAHA